MLFTTVVIASVSKDIVITSSSIQFKPTSTPRISQSSYQFEPMVVNPSIDNEMGLNKLILEGYSGKNITIAILDTGIVNGDPRFQRNGENIIKRYINFVKNEPFYDLNGHGTCIAGLIAAQFINEDSPDNGIAPDVDLWSVKILDRDGNGTVENIIEGLEYCVTHYEEIDIINLSFGIIKDEYNKDALVGIETLVKRLWDLGVIVVAAAGNDGNVLESSRVPFYTINTPSSVLEIISVGAIIRNSMADFSSIGPAPITRYTKPDMVASGANLTSTYIDGKYVKELYGTSFSSPILASGIAILLEKVGKKNPNLIKSALVDSCMSLGYFVYEEGAGLPNFTKAAIYLSNESYTGITIFPKTLSFPNFFESGSESPPSNVRELYPSIMFNEIHGTVIVGKNITNPLRVELDQDIKRFVQIENPTMSNVGQYALKIVFAEKIIVNNMLFVLAPGTYSGNLRIYSGESELTGVHITVTVSFITLLRVWWSALMLLFLPFITLLIIHVRKNNNKKKIDIGSTVLYECPKGYVCKCELDGSRCYVVGKSNV